ncbi:MAG: hypothetical protein KF901_22535 [Myxococcales bacterium]|nr:hypothetical protein [Myxococcales bacterium]
MAVDDWNIERMDAGARALLAEAELLGLRAQPCWSVAELELGDAGFERALAWLATLPPDRARRDRESASMGLLLLVIAAEAARREVTSGEVWPVFAHLSMNPQTRQILLDRDGTPRYIVRQALTKAARLFGLRVASDAGHPWYTTVVLQFGLSGPGLAAMLPRWVRAGPPESVDALRSGPQRSEGFERTWQALCALSSPAGADEARVLLERSPWVLSSWLPQLLEAASTARSETARSETARPHAQLDTALAGPVERARVHWDGPRALLSLDLRSELTDARLTAGPYKLLVDGEPRARWVSRRGSFRSLKSSIDDVPPTSTLTITLVDLEGTVALHQDVEVWADDTPVAVFTADGQRLAPARGLPRADLTLAHEPDAELTPPDTVSTRARFGARRATRVVDLGDRQLTLHWPDGTSWSEAGASAPRAALVATTLTSVRLGAEARLSLPRPARTVLSPTGWRVEEGGRVLVGPVGPDATTRWHGRVELSDGSTARVVATLPLHGAAVQRRGEWTLAPAELDVSDLATLRWRFFVDAAVRGLPTLVSGAHLVERIGSTAARALRGRPLGLGEPLAWVDSARVYADPDVTPEPLVDRLVDRGLLSRCALDGSLLRLSLRDELDPIGHEIILWTEDGWRHVDGDDIEADARDWWLDAHALPIALVIAYGEARIASWWRPDWHDQLARAEDAGLDRLARFARVARLPLLQREARPRARELVARAPVPCARQWWTLPDDAPPTPTHPAKPDDPIDAALDRLWRGASIRSEAWLAGQRELFADQSAAIPPDASESLVEVFGHTDEGTHLPTAIARAAALGPQWSTPFLEGQRADLAREEARRAARGVPSLEALAREVLAEEHDELASLPASAALATMARALGVTRQRCEDLLDDPRAPMPFAKRAALTRRDFALLAALRTLPAPRPRTRRS